MSFVHLHCHTEYSLLDGAIRIGDLTKKASSLGMPAAAITDHGNERTCENSAPPYLIGKKQAGISEFDCFGQPKLFRRILL